MLLIVDDVFCHAPDRVEFTLHFDGTYRASGNGAEFANGESRARFLSHFPETTLSERVAHPDHGENLDKPSLVFTTRDEERTHLLIHTLELNPEEHPASFVRLTGETPKGSGSRGTGSSGRSGSTGRPTATSCMTIPTT